MRGSIDVDPLVYALGELTVTMGQLESLLPPIFAYVTGGDRDVARAVLLQHRYARQRQETITVAAQANQRRLGKEMTQRVLELMARAGKLQDDRNRFVHDMWTHDPSAGKWLLTREHKPGKQHTAAWFPRHVEAAEVKAVVDEAKACIADMIRLWIDFADFDAAQGAEPEDDGPRQGGAC